MDFCHAGFSRKTAASYLRATDGRPCDAVGCGNVGVQGWRFLCGNRPRANRFIVIWKRFAVQRTFDDAKAFPRGEGGAAPEQNIICITAFCDKTKPITNNKSCGAVTEEGKRSASEIGRSV